jgi:hypothetical protein
MKKIQLAISPKFNPKIKTFFISNGENKIILARQFISMTRQELETYHTGFLVNLLKKMTKNINIKTSFNLFDKSYGIYYSYKLKSSKIYFVLISEISFNPLELNNCLKTITTFITSIITNNINRKGNEGKNEIDIIKDNAYDIIFAIDDIINPILGNEGISQSKILENIKMKSSEEEYVNKLKKEKIEEAHNKLIKGMEEIERLKYEKKYIQNGITNETLKEREEMLESERLIKEYTENQKKEEEKRRNFIRNRNRSLKFNNNNRHVRTFMHFTQEDREEMNNFVNVCENLISNLMIRELRKIENGEESDDDNNFGNVQFFVLPGSGLFEHIASQIENDLD